MNKIVIVSDLHAGDLSNADDFAENDRQFTSWLRRLNARKRYLAGDIYELWQFKTQDIRNKHFLLVRYIEDHCERIRGNHDYQLMGPLTRTLRTKSGKKILISHGFQNDKWMTNPLTRLGIWALTWLERFFPGIDNESTYSKHKNKTRIEKKTRKYAEKMLDRGYDIVVCGHTHKQTLIEYDGGKFYANCGTCIHGKLQGVMINLDTDNIELI